VAAGCQRLRLPPRFPGGWGASALRSGSSIPYPECRRGGLQGGIEKAWVSLDERGIEKAWVSLDERGIAKAWVSLDERRSIAGRCPRIREAARG
jgi:hypothetical protein